MNNTDHDLTKLVELFESISSNSYIKYIQSCRKEDCLGFEAKVKSGKFGEAQLLAHKEAQEMLGRHRAFAEAAQMLRKAI